MTFERRDIDVGELTAILERAGAGALSAEERDKLKAALDTLAFLTGEIGAKGMTIERLRRMLFGARTEKTDTLFPDPPAGAGAAGEPGDSERPDQPPRRRPGQGRIRWRRRRSNRAGASGHSRGGQRRGPECSRFATFARLCPLSRQGTYAASRMGTSRYILEAPVDR